ncbi:MAG: 2-oxoacid:acceptor oxidoreductase family protein [Thermoprotei archaeon]
MFIEIRWHGRGGQGVWTASNLLAMAAALEGKHVQSFPAFGPERSGAPVLAFTRISDEPIEVHSMVYEPDVVVVLDYTLLGSRAITEGLKKNGIVISNYEGDPSKAREVIGVGKENKVYITPASRLALEILKRPITNTAMLGALVKAVPVVKLESVFKAIEERFPGPLAEKNIELVKRAYEETREV